LNAITEKIEVIVTIAIINLTPNNTKNGTNKKIFNQKKIIIN